MIDKELIAQSEKATVTLQHWRQRQVLLRRQHQLRKKERRQLSLLSRALEECTQLYGLEDTEDRAADLGLIRTLLWRYKRHLGPYFIAPEDQGRKRGRDMAGTTEDCAAVTAAVAATAPSLASPASSTPTLAGAEQGKTVDAKANPKKMGNDDGPSEDHVKPNEVALEEHNRPKEPGPVEERTSEDTESIDSKPGQSALEKTAPSGQKPRLKQRQKQSQKPSDESDDEAVPEKAPCSKDQAFVDKMAALVKSRRNEQDGVTLFYKKRAYEALVDPLGHDDLVREGASSNKRRRQTVQRPQEPAVMSGGLSGWPDHVPVPKPSAKSFNPHKSGGASARVGKRAGDKGSRTPAHGNHGKKGQTRPQHGPGQTRPHGQGHGVAPLHKSNNMASNSMTGNKTGHKTGNKTGNKTDASSAPRSLSGNALFQSKFARPKKKPKAHA